MIYQRTKRITVVLLLILGLVSVATVQAKKPPKPPGGGGGGDTLEYDIYQLDSAQGAYSCWASDLNDIGTVVGSVVGNATGERFAAYWDVVVVADGTVTSHLNPLPESNLLPEWSLFHAGGVNNLGEVVGGVRGELGWIGLYWPSVDDDPLPLLPLSGDTDAQPNRINDAGIVCGESDEHPVIWRVTSDSHGDPVVLGPFPLPFPLLAVAGTVCDLSEPDADGIVTVAGETWGGGWSAAVTWRVQLQANGGVLIGAEPRILQVGMNANGVNNTGVVCGDSGRPDWIAMLWTETDSTPLELPRRFSYSRANDLNDSGRIVGGVSVLQPYPYQAAVWARPDAKPVLLSSFLGRKSPFDGLTDTNAINQAGVIVGVGWDGVDDFQQAFIALPK